MNDRLTPSLPHTEHLARLGEQLRAVRKAQKVSATTAAESAGMSRVTLHRIERGEPSVTMGAWHAAATTLGLQLALHDPQTPAPAPRPFGDKIALADYPQLKRLAWQLHGVDEVTPQEALSLYERNWQHVDRAHLTMKEVALVNALGTILGGGRPLV
jgi:transcriptional regulator with XRE-family HTH domain